MPVIITRKNECGGKGNNLITREDKMDAFSISMANECTDHTKKIERNPMKKPDAYVCARKIATNAQLIHTPYQGRNCCISKAAPIIKVKLMKNDLPLGRIEAFA